MLCDNSHIVIVPGGTGSYWTAAFFVVRGLYQIVKGYGDRFRQCIINAGIRVGIRHGTFGHMLTGTAKTLSGDPVKDGVLPASSLLSDATTVSAVQRTLVLEAGRAE